MSTKVVVFSDFICPFCYIGMHTLRRLQPEFGFEVDWRGFQIHPEWPAQGVPAEQYLPSDGRAAAQGGMADDRVDGSRRRA